MFTLAQIREKISARGINPDTITVVAVTKTVTLKKIEEAVAAGFTHFGESRVQEAEEKIPYFRKKYPHLVWHLIGHLQTNKAKKAVDLFDFIQSVDSLHLVQEISRRAQAAGKEMGVLLEVKVSEEQSKFGIEPSSLCDIIQKIAVLPAISVKGLMTIAPLLADKEQTRPYFRALKQLADKVREQQIPLVQMQILSMGMSDDFEVALQEGANMVRLGRVIFQG